MKVGRLDDAQRSWASPGAPSQRAGLPRSAGHLAKRRGRLVEAEEFFRNALIMDDKNLEVALELAGVLLAQQDSARQRRS